MSGLNILIVEDESLLALDLAITLKGYDFNVVDYVTSAKEAKKIIDKYEINLILMDINLNEELDGIDLYKSLNTDALVIYITAYRDDKTIEKAVVTSPLGYLLKPHNERELIILMKLAEVKLNIKSIENNTEFISLAHNYTFNIKENRLYHKKTPVKLGAKKIKLLKLLVEARGEIVSFKTIEDELYGDSVPGESSIRTLIYRLRNELEYDMIENKLNEGISLKMKDSSPDTCGT